MKATSTLQMKQMTFKTIKVNAKTTQGVSGAADPDPQLCFTVIQAAIGGDKVKGHWNTVFIS